MLHVRIRKGLPGGFRLDVEFEAPPGFNVLFGASGSGKTLTLKSIAGLERPDEGLISVGGRTLFDSARGLDLPARERHAGYVFQHLALFPHLTARENVEFPLRALPARERRARALGLLEQFGVAHTAGRLPRAISGGEAQRVALARALASAPRMLLLDEPLSALDEPVKLDIIEDLKRLNRGWRLPVLYVTHSREEAVALGERALIYERGRVLAAGEPLEVFGAPVRASVARLTGVENIFAGTVEARDEAAATMRVRLGEGGGGNAGDGDDGARGGQSCLVEAPLGRQPVGGRVRVAVRSGDVMLATSEPRGLSARNLLRGSVARVEPRAAETLVHVEAGVTWAAAVTRQSIQELGLEAGKPVWLAFKTYAVRVFDEE